jgi:hypothetical protein
MYLRESALLEQIDPRWVRRLRRYTTPKPCRDAAALVPALAPLARTTIRLNPHRLKHADEIAAWEPKIGGLFLWPEQEPWPFCEEHNFSLVPVLQLRQCDAPEVPFFRDNDVLQILWCPHEDPKRSQPHRPCCLWRRSREIDRPLDKVPSVLDAGFRGRSDRLPYIPRPCRLYPERVVEYPTGDNLYHLVGEQQYREIHRALEELDLRDAEDLADRFASENPIGSVGSLFSYELGQCRGSKVGGRPASDSRERWEHLLTLSSWEFDAASYRRWLSLEDRRRVTASPHPFSLETLIRGLGGHEGFTSLREPTGLTLGRTQRLHVYVHRGEDEWPVWFHIGD